MAPQTYDYVIIGAGPAGLCTAWLLAQRGRSCIVIDREQTIGGCHRVRRTEEGLFTEHGPRIYVDNYLTFKQWLKQMGLDFYQLFTPYRYSILDSIVHRDNSLTVLEMVCLAKAFFWQGEDSSKRLSLLEFMDNNGFSRSSKDYLDQICRLTDGAGADR